MPRRPVAKPRKPGRPLLLNDQVADTLVQASRAGVPIGVAAMGAGISEDSFNNWLNRGRTEMHYRAEGRDPDPEEQPFVDLLMKVTQARAEAVTRNAILIQKVAQGGHVVEETKEKLPDGTERETVRRTPPDWRAAAWYLERQARPYFGKEAMGVEVTGAGGGPIQVESLDTEALAARVAANIAAVAAQQVAELEAGDDDSTIEDAELV